MTDAPAVFTRADTVLSECLTNELNKLAVDPHIKAWRSQHVKDVLALSETAMSDEDSGIVTARLKDLAWSMLTLCDDLTDDDAEDASECSDRLAALKELYFPTRAPQTQTAELTCPTMYDDGSVSEGADDGVVEKQVDAYASSILALVSALEQALLIAIHPSDPQLGRQSEAPIGTQVPDTCAWTPVR